MINILIMTGENCFNELVSLIANLEGKGIDCHYLKTLRGEMERVNTKAINGGLNQGAEGSLNLRIHLERLIDISRTAMKSAIHENV